MTAMRALLAFSLVLLFAVPLFASAVELPVDKDVCRSNRLSIEKGEVRLTNTEPATYKKCTELKGKNATNAQLEGAKLCGVVAFPNVAGKSCPDISKCDPKYKDKLAACMNDVGLSALGGALQEAAEHIGTGQPLPQSVQDALKGAGLTEEEIDDISNNVADADKLKDLGKAIETGDADKIDKALSGLGLSEETLRSLKDNAARLSDPDRFASAFTEKELQEYRGTVEETFPGPQPLVLDATGQPSAPLLPGNKIDPTVLGSIAADAQRRVCSTVRGACYVTTQAQFATMMNETPGNVRLYGDGGRSTSLAQVYQPTANGLLNTYRQVYGEEYMLNKVDIRDTSLNPEWIASQSLRMQALVLQQKGDATGGNYARMLSAYNGGGYAAAVYGSKALNNTYLLQNGNASGYWQAAYSAATEAVTNGPTITNLTQNLPVGGQYSASPFGNVNPFGGYSNNRSAGTYQSPFSNTLPVGYSQSSYGGSYGGGVSSGGGTSYPQQQQQPQQPISQTILQQGNVQADGGVPQALQAVASIIAQPREVARGNPVIVSWSSVGTNPSAPCEVFLRSGTGTSSIARGNEGSQKVPTSGAATVPIVWGFTLQCTALSGMQLIQQATSVSIK